MDKFIEELLDRVSTISPFYLVGGAVRDQLLNRPSKDIDGIVAISLAELEKHLRKWGYHPITIGAMHQTLSVFQQGERVDFNPYDGDLIADALRRDFTINAIFLDARTGEIIDPLDGKSDLEKKVLRACGNPQERFKEDPIRILRMVRFSVKYGMEIEEKTFTEACSLLSKLKEVAPERISEELSRILTLDDPIAGLHLLDELGFVDMFLPELARLKGLAQNRYHLKDAWEHTLQVTKNTPPQLILRLAGLFHDLGKRHFLGHEKESGQLSQQVLSRFRFSMVLGREGEGGEKDLIWLVENHMSGTQSFFSELRGEGSGIHLHPKMRSFVLDKGWDGRTYNLKRVDQLISLWRADFYGGRKRETGEEEIFDRLIKELRAVNLAVQKRNEELDWDELVKFARDHNIEGRKWGEFKETLRRSLVVSEEEILLNQEYLEREYKHFRGRDKKIWPINGNI